MDKDCDLLSDPRMQSAIQEMKALVRARFPETTFSVGYGEDPYGVYLLATVDVEDRNEVIDLYIDRLVDLHLDEELRLHVLPVRTPERNAEIWREQRRSSRPAEALPIS